MGVVCQRGDDGADECAYRNRTYFCNEWIDADPEVIFGGAPSLGCAVRLRVEERPVAVGRVGRPGGAGGEEARSRRRLCFDRCLGP